MTLWEGFPKTVVLSESLSSRHGKSSGGGWIYREVWLYWISSRRVLCRGGPPIWELSEGLITIHH